MADSEISVRDDPAQSRYEIYVDGDRAGFSVYRDEPGRRVFTHTVVDDDYEGQGLGSRLAAEALDDTRSRGLSVVPRCPFIRAYIERHPAYADLLA
ncbi:MAG TPA: GNAT family N-acetyltransferase [Jatrophihabitantaceae bacterium]|jgi:predicted GNAT family acetyltransferase